MEALRVIGLLTLVIGLLALPSSAMAQAPGGLTQLPGTDGCHLGPAFESPGATCTAAEGQGQGQGIAISPDQKNVYVVSFWSSGPVFGQTVLVFDRNATTGVLTRKPGAAGCYAHDNSGGGNTNCTDVRAMFQPRGIVATNNAVYVAAAGSDAIVVFTRNPDGTLSQKTTTTGCIVEDNTIGGDAGTCADGSLLVDPQGLAMSSDGKHLYAASQTSDAVAAFGISSVNQTLVQTPGTCIQDSGGSPCADGRALDGAFSVKVSPDGNKVYAGTVGDNSLTVMDRASNTGALTPVAGATGCVDNDAIDLCTNLGSEMGDVYDLVVSNDNNQIYAAVGNLDRVLLFDRSGNGIVRRSGAGGCVSEAVVANCTQGRGLSFPHGITLSGDQRHVYVTGFNSGSLVELVRASDGSIAPTPGVKGCYSAGSVSTACQTGNGIAQGRAVVVTDDGRFVYTTGDFSRTNAFLRDANPPVCQDGSATIGAGQSIVLNLPCTDDPGDPVEIAIVTPPNGGSVGSVDQAAKQVSFTAFAGFSGTTSFTFRATSGGVSSATKTFTINVTGAGAGPPRAALIRSTVTARWSPSRRFTTVRVLSVNRLPAGARVVTTCRTKQRRLQRKRCPYRSRTVRSPAARAKLNLAKPFRKRKLPVGTKIRITITAPGFIGKVFTYTIRARRPPRVQRQCVSPGAKPSRCP